MKKIICISAALLALLSCEKAVRTNEIANAGKVTLSATAFTEDATRVSVGTLTSDKYPLSWDVSEYVYLREICWTSESEATTQDCGSDSFTKSSATNGKFSFTLAAKEDEGTYNYVSVYPSNPEGYKTNLDHGVRYGGTDQKNRVSYILNHTLLQKPLAGAPDPATHIMVAKDMAKTSQADAINLNFKPVVSYAKMTVVGFPALAAGETVSKITVTAPSDIVMTGRLYHNIADDSTIPYNATNVKNYVMINPENISFNTTGFDVWFTTFPFDLASGSILSLKVETSVKTYEKDLVLSKALSFKAGSVSAFTYKWTKGEEIQKKVLTFDFSGDVQAGWPAATGWKEERADGSLGKTCTYTLDGVGYDFILACCGGATDVKVYWATPSGGAKSIVLGGIYRYLGLPAISGYKLTKVVATQGTSSNSNRQLAVVKTINPTTNAAPSYTEIEGGNPITTPTKGADYTFTLSGTADNTVYYLYCAKTSFGASKIVLTYEEVK